MVMRVLLALVGVVAALMAVAVQANAKPQPSIELILETDEAFLGDSIIVEVRWIGLLDPVDLSPLTRDADLVRQTAGTRIAVIQGEVVEIASRRVELLPHRVGRLTLGPLVAGDVTSNTVSIDITEAVSIDWAPGPDDIRLTQTVSETNPYLQQQLGLDIELRTRHPLVEENVSLPSLDGFRAIPIYEERRTLDEKDGGWSLTAWRYLLFPQHSGAIVIPGAKVSGTAAKSRAERGAFELTAPDSKLDVRPSAFGAGVWWLAARQLNLRDDWSVDPTKLAAGDEVERTITVEATGALPEQIPDIAPGETRGLSVTPLGVERNRKIVDGVALATAVFRFRVRALSPVPVFLDTVRLRWWNTVEHRAAEAIIPARRIDIAVPERTALVDSALARESVWDRLLDRAGRMETALFAAFGLLLAAAVAASARLGLFTSVGAAIMRARLRREIKSLAAHGDATALHARLRRLSAEDPILRAGLRPSILLLEEQIFAKTPANLRSVADAALAALGRGRGQAAVLPSL